MSWLDRCHGAPSPNWTSPPPEEAEGRTVVRVLVVEDFEVLARSIGTGLRREGMAVDVVLDGNDALGHLAITRYDVVVLDRDLPGVPRRRGVPADRGGGLGQPSADADRGQHGQGPGRRPRTGRRRLPAEAVRLLRARRPGARPRASRHAGDAADARSWRPDARPQPPGRLAGRAGDWTSARRSSPSSNASSPRATGWSPPRNSSNGSGTKPPTPSPPRSRRRCAGCGPSSATRR